MTSKKKYDFLVYDLIMFRNKTTTSLSLSTIHTIINKNGLHINNTDDYSFYDNLDVIYDKNPEFTSPFIEIAGVWRFNPTNKNYECIYYKEELEYDK